MFKPVSASCSKRIFSLLLSFAVLFTAVSCTPKEEMPGISETSSAATSSELSETTTTTTTTIKPEPPDVTGSYLMKLNAKSEDYPVAYRLDLLDKDGRLGFLFTNIYDDYEWVFKVFEAEDKLNDGSLIAEYKDEEISVKVASDGKTADVAFLDSEGKNGPLSGHYERIDDHDEEYHPEAVPESSNDPDTPGGAVDAVLAKAAREYLELPEGAVLTADDLSKVDYLEIINEPSASLNGIEYFTGLRRVSVQISSISDISPLADLKSLEEITFTYAFIDAIPDFSKCESLEYLALQNCWIKDISPVAAISSLKRLYISNNRITSIAPIKDMDTLEEISLYHNPITDWETVSGNGKLISALLQDYDITLKVLDKARQIVKETITDDMGELEKEIAIYRKLHEIADYKSWQRPVKPDGYYILMKGQGVCADWSETTALLMTLAGLDCSEIGSDTHAWNIIKIDGAYYEIDCLWDDGSDPEEWKYFNVSRARMDSVEDHHISMFNYPVAEKSMMKLKYLLLI